MNTKYKIQNTNSNRGAVLLIAVLLSSVMLSVGLGVYQRTYKQLVFSSFWKQMQVAFVAADSGLECVMYWDLHKDKITMMNPPTCFEDPLIGWDPLLSASHQFLIDAPTLCVHIEIIKNAGATTIKARGYNTCNDTNLRRVERALRIDY